MTGNLSRYTGADVREDRDKTDATHAMRAEREMMTRGSAELLAAMVRTGCVWKKGGWG